MTDIRGVLFDLDNTLVNREASIRHYAEAFQRDFGRALPSMSVELIAERLVLADQGGYRNKQDMIAAISAWPEWQSPLDVVYFDRHWMWEFPAHAVAMDDMQATLEMLTARGITLGIITNGSARAQNAKVMALHLWRYCPVILVSESCGLRKPDPSIFALALKQLELSADQVCFVGDHPEADVMAAERAGLTGIWRAGFHRWPEDHPPPTFRVQRLSETPALISRIGEANNGVHDSLASSAS
jgi:putative hydrolase of the HAD superfamily